ncbi:MAG: glutathione S-transferase family protein [Myxococcales bacterium]|nr:glutathione S-transferase family protein [Myxococcales bacterium]
MKLFGTTTSPFVRRVRVVAAELDVAYEFVNTAHDHGQEALRALSPIWKVPVAEVDGRTLFDSRVIIDWLTTTRGYGPLRAPRDRWHEANVVNAIDAALDSIVQVFYLSRDGFDPMTIPFGPRQVDRAAAIFDWVAGELPAYDPARGLGLAELSLVCALDWMDFRKTYPTERHADDFAALRAAIGARASIAATRPMVS